MKKKSIAIIVVLALIVVAGAYVAIRLKNRGADLIGVTTLSAKNTVIMNAKTGKEFVGGEGRLSVREGERIRVEYNLKAGEIDVAFRESGESSAASEDIAPAWDNLAEQSDFGQDSVSGKGSLDFDAAPGDYTVYIAIHDAIGKAVVTAVKAD